MIPLNRLPVPQSPDRRAAMQAIAEVESRLALGRSPGAYPYARAFFRHFRGSRRITLRELRYFSPVLTDREMRGEKESWLQAVDALIESRGACCWLPLPVNAGQPLFPEMAFRHQERQRRQDELRDEKYSRQRRKEACLRERAYKALAGQAEIELAFHTPATVNHWSARWSGTLHEYELEAMFFRWSERFPSLSGLERWAFEGEPLWVLIREAGQLAREALPPVTAMERWMVPNKLADGGRV
jgi:hypothetical protein